MPIIEMQMVCLEFFFCYLEDIVYYHKMLKIYHHDGLVTVHEPIYGFNTQIMYGIQLSRNKAGTSMLMASKLRFRLG